ncbi:MAG: VanZ family protein [Actinobacteria bacterium]|nr:VanZ family protein [Actinomycetota bacterium]
MPRLTPTRRRALHWAAVGAWMVVIFLLSAQGSEDSAALSGAVMQVVLAVLDWTARLFGADGFPAGALDVLHLVVRKAAHFVAYAILGALALAALAPRLGEGGGGEARAALAPRLGEGGGGEARAALVPRPGEDDDGGGGVVVGWREVALALGVSVAYAITDEIHQTFVPGRGGQASDVVHDAAGAFAGILLLRWWWASHRPPAPM